MIPFGGETVTLFRRATTIKNGKSAETWERRVLTGCSWRRTMRDRLVDGAVFRTTEVICRIPSGQLVPALGDLLVRGGCSESPSTAREIALLEKSGIDAFRVVSVSDNSFGPLPHIVVRGG